jgi:UDP-glucose 4-epimerase
MDIKRMPLRYFITGGAGFIGSSLIDRLLQEGNKVVCYDNFSTGKQQFLYSALNSKNFRLVKGDILNLKHLTKSIKDCDFVFHLAANADVRYGLEHPQKDLLVNTVGTSNVLEAMRKNGIKKIVFASTGSVYGETDQIPTPEDARFPIQTSLYGASKLAGEGLIQAYCEGYNFSAWIFRFVSVLGERYTHGHVYDFVKKLNKDPKKLEVLGDGQQKKSYIYVQDLIDGMLSVLHIWYQGDVNIYNLGTDEYCKVCDSINWIKTELNLNPKIKYTGGDRGWIGDNPFIYLDTNKIKACGWKPKVSIKNAIIKTVKWLKENEWVL